MIWDWENIMYLVMLGACGVILLLIGTVTLSHYLGRRCVKLYEPEPTEPPKFSAERLAELERLMNIKFTPWQKRLLVKWLNDER